MVGEPGIEMCTVFGELPSLGSELEMVRNEGPIERWRPFMDPCLVVVVVGRELDSSELVHSVVCMPTQ